MSGVGDSGSYHGAQSHPDGDRCDLEYCQGCGHAFTTAEEGYWVSPNDIGKDAEGETARLFREAAEKYDGQWRGFEEEDEGPWCDSCSWTLQRRRTGPILASDGGTSGGERGKPGSFSRDIIRIEEDPIAVNYHSEGRPGGDYTAKCSDCGDWHRAHSKESAKEDARCCCGNHTPGGEQ